MSNIPPGPKTIFYNGIAIGDLISTGDTEKDLIAAREFLKDKGLQNEVSLFQAIFNQALAFANTSAYLYDRDMTKVERRGFTASAFVVNAAFSIELYLKALAQKHSAILRGHELIKLYEALPAKAAEEINQVIPLCAEKRALGEEPNFQGYLRNLNNTFVEWRYSYELEKTSMFHIEPTIFVMQVLHEACCLSSPA